MMCANSTSQAFHHLYRVLLPILGITLWRFSQWEALVECKDQPPLDQWSSPMETHKIAINTNRINLDLETLVECCAVDHIF